MTKEDAKKKIEKEIIKEEVINDDEEEEVKVNDKKVSGKTLKVILAICIFAVSFILSYLFNTVWLNKNDDKKIDPEVKTPGLPKPEVTEGERGLLGIDKNINEKVVDKYLDRKDIVFRDMRMLEDPAEYENIGGDRYLSGYIKGFEVVPLPYIIPVNNLPEEVGTTFQGDTLFFHLSDGSYVPMYEESLSIIEELFPKDKIIFLMCGGGGYAGMMKEFLVSQGWDKDKIYNIGGYWYYNGKNKIEVPYEDKGTYNEYDFSDVPYHDIDFSELTPIKADRHNKGNIKSFKLEEQYYDGGNDLEYDKLIEKYDNLYDDYMKTHKEYDYKSYSKLQREVEGDIVNHINNLLQDKKSFVITVYNDAGCGDDSDTVRVKAIDFAKENNLYFYDIDYLVFRQTDLYKDVRETPNVIIVKDGKVYTYYDYESDEDLKINESDESFSKWIKKYIKI